MIFLNYRRQQLKLHSESNFSVTWRATGIEVYEGADRRIWFPFVHMLYMANLFYTEAAIDALVGSVSSRRCLDACVILSTFVVMRIVCAIG